MGLGAVGGAVGGSLNMISSAGSQLAVNELDQALKMMVQCSNKASDYIGR